MINYSDFAKVHITTKADYVLVNYYLYSEDEYAKVKCSFSNIDLICIPIIDRKYKSLFKLSVEHKKIPQLNDFLVEVIKNNSVLLFYNLNDLLYIFTHYVYTDDKTNIRIIAMN